MTSIQIVELPVLGDAMTAMIGHGGVHLYAPVNTLPCCVSETLRDATALVTGTRSIVPQPSPAPTTEQKV